MIAASSAKIARPGLMMQQQMSLSSVRLQGKAVFSTYTSLRKQSNTSTSASASSPPTSPTAETLTSQVPPHRRSNKPPSRHKLFYRDIVPPLVRVLAYGSIVYFSLHLTWQYLDGREQKQLEDQVRSELEAQVRQRIENKGVVERQGSSQSGKSWWSWLGGK